MRHLIWLGGPMADFLHFQMIGVTEALKQVNMEETLLTTKVSSHFLLAIYCSRRWM